MVLNGMGLMKKYVDMDVYYDKLVDYFYDNIYWKDSDDAGKGSLNQWLEQEYGANISMTDRKIYFNSLPMRTWFIMRWI